MVCVKSGFAGMHKTPATGLQTPSRQVPVYGADLYPSSTSKRPTGNPKMPELRQFDLNLLQAGRDLQSRPQWFV
jgi:hypothetical protein